FSPILPIRPLRTSSTVGPKPSCDSGSSPMAATSAGLCSAISSATDLAKARKDSFLETKSVSQLISTRAPVVPSTAAETTPSAVTREAALEALLPSFTRRISSAFAKSPSASVRAFLHSIIGASVLARSSATMLAVIAAICFLRSVQGAMSSSPHQKFSEKKGLMSPSLRLSRRGSGCFVDFHELVVAGVGSGNHFVHGVGLAFQDGVGHGLGVQGHSLGRVVVAG